MQSKSAGTFVVYCKAPNLAPVMFEVVVLHVIYENMLPRGVGKGNGGCEEEARAVLYSVERRQALTDCAAEDASTHCRYCCTVHNGVVCIRCMAHPITVISSYLKYMCILTSQTIVQASSICGVVRQSIAHKTGR